MLEGPHISDTERARAPRWTLSSWLSLNQAERFSRPTRRISRRSPNTPAGSTWREYEDARNAFVRGEVEPERLARVARAKLRR